MASRSYKEFAPSHKSAPDPSCKRIGDVPGDERFEVSIYLKPRNNERSAGNGERRRALAWPLPRTSGRPLMSDDVLRRT